MSSYRLGLFIAGICLLVLAAAWHPWSGGSHDRAAEATLPGEDVEPSDLWVALQKAGEPGPTPAALWAAERRGFRVMRGSPERMPSHLTVHTGAVLGIRPALLRADDAQYASTSAGGIWIVSGGYATCMVEAGRGAVTCNTTDAFVRRGLVLGVVKAPERASEPPSDFLLLGVAPDWAKKARLQVGIHTRTVPIRGNAYALRAGVPVKLERLER